MKIQPKPALIQLQAIPSGHQRGDQCQCLPLSSPFSLLQAEQSRWPQPLLISFPSRPVTTFAALLWMLSNTFKSFFWGTQNCPLDSGLGGQLLLCQGRRGAAFPPLDIQSCGGGTRWDFRLGRWWLDPNVWELRLVPLVPFPWVSSACSRVVPLCSQLFLS